MATRNESLLEQHGGKVACQVVFSNFAARGIQAISLKHLVLAIREALVRSRTLARVVNVSIFLSRHRLLLALARFNEGKTTCLFTC